MAEFVSKFKGNYVVTSSGSTSGSFKNYTRRAALNLYEGPALPSSSSVGTIDSVTYKFQLKARLENQDDYYITLRENEDDEPTYSSNILQDSSPCYILAGPYSVPTEDRDTNGNITHSGTITVTAESSPTRIRRLYGKGSYLQFCLAAGTSKTVTRGYVNTSLEWECIVNWHDDTNYQKPNFPSNISLSRASFTITEAANGINTILRWNKLSMPSEASNSITEIQIHRKPANGNWSKIGTASPALTEYPITVPSSKGVYYYTVCPITGTDSNYNLSPAELESKGIYALLTVSEIGNVTAPTSVWSSFGGQYLGESNKPNSFTIYWSGAKGGTNNPIKSYQITCPNGDVYTINNPSATSYQISQSPSTGNYSITVWGEKDTTATAITTVTLFNPLSRPVTPTITTQPSGEIIESSFTVKWSAATRPADVNSIAYIVYHYRNSSWNWLTETNNPQIDLESSNFTGTNNRIGVITRYYSSNGTYTDSSGMATTNVLKYATEIPLPDPFWASHYDTTTSTLTGKAENIYNNIKLTWYAIKDDNYSSSTEFSYQVYRSVNSGAYTALTGALLTKGNTGGTLTYTDNDIKNYRNSQIKYYILITNKSTNKTVKSPDTPNINVIKEIVITNFEVAPGSNEITSTNMPIRFNWTSGLPVLSEGSGISASLYMTYNNTTTLIESWSNLQENDRNAITPIDISLVGKQNFGDVFSQLYNRVITEGYPQPQVKLDLRLKYNAFSGSEISKEVSPVKLSYFTAPKISTNGQLTVKLPDDRNYYNPGEEAIVTLTGFSWADAAGNSTSPATEVKNYLYDKSTKQKYELSTSNNSTTVQLPVTSAVDMTLNLSLVTDIVYKGENITKQYELDRSCSIPIARWIAEAVAIRNVRKTERTGWDDWLEGSLIIPERYCGSDLYQNTVNIIPSLIDNSITCVFTNDNSQNGLNNNNILTTFQPSQLISDSSGKKRIINFLIYSQEEKETNYANIMLNFNVIFTNTSTSNNTLTIDNILYRVLSAEVDFAVRKGKIGVNVSKDFGTSTDKSNSVLELNTTKTSEDAIMKITSAGSIENGKTKYISFLDSSGQKELSIYTENDEVFIDNLHIGKLLSPDKNTILTLNNSGILLLNGTKNETVLTSENYSEYINLTLVGANNSGTVPEYGTSSGGTITTTAANRVLTVNDGTLGWYSLPENAFKDTTYDAATTTSMGLMSAADKVKLNGIATEANKYVLPNATTSTLGGVIVGRGLTVSSGTISTHKIIYQTTEPTSGMQAGDLWLKPKN